MQPHPTPPTSPPAAVPFWRRGWVVGVLLFLVAFVPAALPHPVYTTDETRVWEMRTAAFRAAMQNGNPANTILTHHPGVLTMWLGWAGLSLESPFNPDGTMRDGHRIFFIRVPSALYNALGVLLGYWLLRRLFGDALAAFAGLLWATDPYLTAHSGILHIDALATTNATLALLALVLAARAPRGVGWWVVAGVFTGLAALAKFSLFFMCGMALVAVWLHTHDRPTRQRLVRVLWTTALVTAIAVMTFVVLYPGVLAAPARFLETTLRGVTDFALAPHENGNFFWGRVVPDPGPLFYPVVLAFRLTPWVLAGLVVLPFGWRAHPVATRRALLTLVAFGVLFTLFMTVQDKKFDRYVLPIFPALAILAAVGLSRLFARWPRRAALLQGGVGVVALLQLAIYYPNELAYFNPLVGGGAVAEHVLLLGWGEGYAEAVAYLQEREGDGCVPGIASSDTFILSRHFPRGCEVHSLEYNADGLSLRPDVRYGLVTTNQLQRDPALAALLAPHEPIHRVELFGATYLQLYAVADLR